MTQVNLLPRDVLQRQRTRRVTAAVVAACLAVVGILLLVFVLQAARLRQAESRLEAQRATNQNLSAKIASLQPFQALKQQVASRQALNRRLLQGEVLWSGVLHDLSAIIPGRVWLTSVSGTAAAGAPGAVGTASTPGLPATGTGGGAGTLQFQGGAFEHTDLSLWLTRLAEVNGWVNPWIMSSTRGSGGGTVQWSGSVDLTQAATADGGGR